MPQKIVPLVCGEFYHIFNRGVDKRETFMDREDYLRFYQTLHLFNTIEPVINFDAAKARSKNGQTEKVLVEIKAYSILPNHYHMIIKQISESGISEFMRRISTGYTTYFNQKHERSGALFQGKYKRVHIQSDEQYNYLFAYVNENHFVHNIRNDRQICHSSSIHYQGIARSKLIKTPADKKTYEFSANQTLAMQIYNERKRNKIEKVIFE